MNNKKTKPALSAISAIHYFKLVFRSCLFVTALVLYIINRINGTASEAPFGNISKMPFILVFIWVVFVVEMFFRCFPSKLESMGCQKQFSKNYKPVKKGAKPQNQSGIVTFAVFSAWTALNAVIGILYFSGLIDAGILLLISLFYSVCDMICILFFCPFQSWFMKNRCCASCRIYNWDYAMMFTPLVFVPTFYTWSLLALAVLLLVIWEVTYKLHPERFSEASNACLACANCPEKLCQHKKHLRIFWKKNKKRIVSKGNSLINEHFPDRKK